ncbi:hypothetical protein HZA76_03190 [Candidatus Roizmanbacteria bacterium]|nr:hypothetical protein [Candidatus Roizmanbacteria bacterium]
MLKFFRYLILFLILFFSLSFLDKVRAIECNTGVQLKTQQEIDEFDSKCVKPLRNQINTLSEQIQYMNNQIYLTTTLIQQTEQKIVATQKEIDILGSRIEGLDDSLTNLSDLLIRKIIKDYKQRSVSLFGLLFDSQNANELISKIKYVKTVRDNNQKLLVQVQEAKSNFEEQKKLRETKKIELDELTQTLTAQQQSLNDQKIQKQKLLADTQNDESTYQRLIQQARAQLAGFKSFVTSAGAGIISANQFGNGSDGSYYSQRDARWASQTIGYSSENILDVGCLLTSVAMVAKRYGSSVTPAEIASDTNRFFGNTAYMSLPWKSVAGKNYQGGVDIDQELANGNYVIVGVGGCASGGSHFVVLTKKEGDDYIMHDPIFGPDIKFSSHYSNICSTGTFK